MRLLSLGFLICTSAAQADVSVRFIEGAPKDRFVVENTGTCDLRDFDLELRLDGSAAGLIFDTTASGAGVEVFQPLDIVEGRMFLGNFAGPNDGDARFLMPFVHLPPGGRLAFTIDVDDTLAASASGQIIVRGGEISGATVVLKDDGTQRSGAFSDRAVALVKLPGCAA